LFKDELLDLLFADVEDIV
jgi:hypothetical protein